MFFVDIDGSAICPEHTTRSRCGGACGEGAASGVLVSDKRNEIWAGIAAKCATEALTDIGIRTLRRIFRRVGGIWNKGDVVDLRLGEMVSHEAMDIVPVFGKGAIDQFEAAEHHIGDGCGIAEFQGHQLPLKVLGHPAERGAVAADVVVKRFGASNIAVLREHATDTGETRGGLEGGVYLALEFGFVGEKVGESGQVICETDRQIEGGLILFEFVMNHKGMDESRIPQNRIGKTRRFSRNKPFFMDDDIAREGIDNHVEGENALWRQATRMGRRKGVETGDQGIGASVCLPIVRIQLDHPVESGKDDRHFAQHAIIDVSGPRTAFWIAKTGTLFPPCFQQLFPERIFDVLATGRGEDFSCAGDGFEPRSDEFGIILAGVFRKGLARKWDDLTVRKTIQSRIDKTRQMV